MNDNNIELREIPRPYHAELTLSTEEMYGILVNANNSVVEIISKGDMALLKRFKIQSNILGGLKLATPALIESFKDKDWILDISKIEKEERSKWENDTQISFHGEVAHCSLRPVIDLLGKAESAPKNKKNLAYSAEIMGISVLAYGAVTAIFGGYISYLHFADTCQAPKTLQQQLERK